MILSAFLQNPSVKTMEQILEMITTYGLETVAIALIINVLTGFVKMPIKSLANKLKDYTKIEIKCSFDKFYV